MERAIRARQLISRVVERTNDGRIIVLHTRPILDDLPEWVGEAFDEGFFVVSARDDYTGVWVMIPGQGLAMRADPKDVLVNRGSYVGFLQEL